MHRRVTVLLILLIISQASFPATSDATARGVDRVCADQADELFAHELSNSVDQIQTLTGCARSADGTWFWPGSDSDQRLVEPVMTPDEFDATRPIHESLRDDIMEFV
jgi:hypothetical protein